MNSNQIVQLARILGQGDFFSCLSMAKPRDLDTLNAEQLAQVQALAARNVPKIARTLVHEAMADDSIITAADAEAYLQRRLSFFGELLTEETKQQVAEAYRSLTCHWG